MTVVTAAKSFVTTYAEDVVSGRILAGRLVRLMAERHLRDLESGHERGLRFDDAKANRAINFIELLNLAEGEFAGKPFLLQLWQKFIVGCLFGWLGPDGYRRFRKAYIEIGKGNGKSPLAAAIGLYLLVADGEDGAEIYSAAPTRDQARISFTDAKNMADASDSLSHRLTVLANNIAYPKTNSFFRPVSSEARALDGKRVQGAIIDEVHEHPSNIVVEKMQAGTKGRRQPLIFEITNSGYDRHTVCYAHHDYSVKVLEGMLDDDGWFAYVCQLDPCDECYAAGQRQPKDGCEKCDDWQDEAVWDKTNPNLGVSVTLRYLREQVREAQGMPTKMNIVRRLNFCIWTEGLTRWLDMAKYDAAPPRKGVEGRACYAGLDLSKRIDITALVLLFPDGLDGYDVLPFFWVPEDTMRERSKIDRVPYDVWVRQGYIKATPGNVIDYSVIRADLKEIASLYRIQEIDFDPYNASHLITELQDDGFTCVEIRQGFLSLSDPTKEVETLVVSGKFRHGDNPVLRWMFSNVVAEEDAAGNIKPSKDKSTEKIDGVSATVTAMARALVAGQGGSVYDTEELLIL